MITTLDHLRTFGFCSLILRLTLAMLFGGVIGLEGARKGRPAGFRTYMLVCLGAALTMLLGQYEIQMMEEISAHSQHPIETPLDVARFSAQVINGIGFLGAGTIIVTGKQQVKGLTTAAGLWTTAIIGLASGMGFYECSIAATLLILFAEIVLSKLENILHARRQEIHLYIEYTGSGYLNHIIEYFKRENIPMLDVEIIKKTKKDDKNNIAIITIQLHRHLSRTTILKDITEFPQTIAVEIL